MRNAEIADAFTELADRLALTDLKPFRYMAYRTAAATFRELSDSVAVLSAEGRLCEIKGIGPAIEDKVHDLLTTGTFPALERAREDVHDTLLALTTLPGVGAATAQKVFASTDGESFESLLERAAKGMLPTGDGVTAKVVSALAAEHAARASGEGGDAGAMSGVPRDERGVPLPGPWIRRDQALELIDATRQLLTTAGARDAHASGAYVRGLEVLRGVSVVATADDPPAALTALADTATARGWELPDAPLPRLPLFAGLDAAEVVDQQLVSPAGIPVVIAVAVPAAVARAAHRMAGPGAWIAREPEPLDASVPYELRDRVLADELAPEDVPADLLTVGDLRGELHAHSDWSDGTTPVLEMARAARARGDEFFAVTDHSAPYALVGGLDPDRLLAQAEEIAAANELLAAEHAAGDAPAFRVLRGTELEVLADGSLGLPDSALEQLDWVIASIHMSQRQSPAQLLERMRRVAENPLVDAVGHPTSRRLLRRARTALDVNALIELAAASKLVLEINANPDRLDLDSIHAARALASGVLLTVNTDAHRPSSLALRDHGVAVARRAGARTCDVVNCRSVVELLAARRRHAGA